MFMEEVDAKGIDRRGSGKPVAFVGDRSVVFNVRYSISIDPAFAPLAQGTLRGLGGLTSLQSTSASSVVSAVYRSIALADVVEVSPPFDPSGNTAHCWPPPSCTSFFCLIAESGLKPKMD